MKLIKPSFEILEQPSGLEGVYKQIERAGRVCYKSENKITEDSAKPFVDRMIKSGHGAMLEHGTVCMERYSIKDDNLEWAYKYNLNPYARVSYGTGSHRVGKVLYNTMYVTTNLRVLVEGNYLGDLKYLCEPTKYHGKRITVKFICDRGVSHEFVRHRVFSFAQESTRYCNYSKDKFGNELTFIEPLWLDDLEWDTYTDIYKSSLACSEDAYFELLKQWNERIPDKRYKSGFKNNPWTPQQARAVLPNSLKTELVMTGFVSDWKHFFELRCSPSAHPQARELAIPLQEEFIARGYINN